MSTVWQVVSIVTLVAVIATAAIVLTRESVVTAQPVQAQAANEQSGITIVAQGEVKATPDLARVSLGVRTSAATAEEAMAQNNQRMAAVIAKLEQMGVAKKDMQTGRISLSPQTKPAKAGEEGTDTIVGYWASNSLNVTVRDLGKVGAVLDAGIAAGANSVSGISFGVADDAKLRDEALKEAVKNARAKADLVAAGFGLKVTGVRSVTVESYGGGMPIYMDYATARAAPSAVPVEAGELTFTASVRVTFGF